MHNQHNIDRPCDDVRYIIEMAMRYERNQGFQASDAILRDLVQKALLEKCVPTGSA